MFLSETNQFWKFSKLSCFGVSSTIGFFVYLDGLFLFPIPKKKKKKKKKILNFIGDQRKLRKALCRICVWDQTGEFP